MSILTIILFIITVEFVTTHRTPKAYIIYKSFEAPKEIVETK